MELSRDILDTLYKVASDWSQGVAVIKPFGGDLVFVAVTGVSRFSPSNNIHFSTVTGKDITMMIEQKLSIVNPRGSSPVVTYVDNIKKETTWELTPEETWYWVRVRDIS